MSTRSSLKEALGRRGKAEAASRVRSGSSVKLVIRGKTIERPVDLARLLADHGLTLSEAHAALDKLVAGRPVRLAR